MYVCVYSSSNRFTCIVFQVCAGTVAEILPPEVVIRVLKPLIQMADYPVNQASIKMLNKLVEAHQPSIVAAALPEIMPGLIKVSQNELVFFKTLTFIHSCFFPSLPILSIISKLMLTSTHFWLAYSNIYFLKSNKDVHPA